MSWLGVISGLIGLASSVMKWALAQGYIKQGEAQHALRSLEQAEKDVAEARKARLDQRAATDRDLADDGSLSDDKFTRPD